MMKHLCRLGPRVLCPVQNNEMKPERVVSTLFQGSKFFDSCPILHDHDVLAYGQ